MSDEFPGFRRVTDGLSDFSTMQFVATQVMAGMATAQLVKVLAVKPGEGLLAGVVTCQLMVSQIDPDGKVTAHGPMYNIPWMRLQGGKNACIIDPVKGDIGLAIFAMRDISSVKASKDIAAPGSRRIYDYADGLYVGGFLNQVPTQYIQFVNDDDGAPKGIKILDVNGNSRVMDDQGIIDTDLNGNTVVMDSDGVKINGVLFDRSQNVSGVAELTSTDTTSLGGGAKKVVLDGDAVVAGHVVASSTKVTAT